MLSALPHMWDIWLALVPHLGQDTEPTGMAMHDKQATNIGDDQRVLFNDGIPPGISI